MVDRPRTPDPTPSAGWVSASSHRAVAMLTAQWSKLPVWGRRLLGGSVLVALLLLLVAPDEDSGTPVLNSSQIGTVAPFDLKATRSFTWERPNPDGVTAARERATSAILPVWDYEPTAVDDVVDETVRAFETARAQLRVEASKRREALPSRTPPEVPEGSGDPLDPPPDAPPPRRSQGPFQEDYPPSRLLELLDADARYATVRDLAVFDELGEERRVRLPARSVAALAAEGFSVETQTALVALIRAAMERHLVENRSQLDDLGPEGITLRTLEPAGTTERQLRNHRDFYDVQSVRDIAYGLTTRLSGIDDTALITAIEDVLYLVARPNTRPNPIETNRRRATAADAAEESFRRQQRLSVQEGELIVRAGEVITADIYGIFEAMRAGEEPRRTQWISTVALGLLIGLLLWSVFLFARMQLRYFSSSTRDLTMMGTVLVVHVALTALVSMIADAVAVERGTEAIYIVRLFIPYGVGAMLVRLLTRADNSVVYSLVYAMLAGLMLDYDVDYALLALVAGLVGGMTLGTAESRAAVFTRCVWMGLALAGVTLTLSVARGGLDWQFVAFRTGAAFLSGPISAAVLFFLLPLLEYVFRYTTVMRLMELSSLNHPLLKDLILKSPGTYHHSMMVGQLVEAGCEAVGADALLGRVGAYFHDVGKMKNAKYFAENQHGKNPHDSIGPYISAKIIKSHVREGVEMAREHNLPEEIIRFIEEHHGTSLIRFFYHKACEENPDVLESDFRYPGPVPQSRETAICLLADGIEAASRAMPDPSPARLRGLIQRMINGAFTDGQLDQCDLTLRDLHRIADAFHQRLTAFYHHRPEYPDARKSSSSTRTTGGNTAVRGSSPPRTSQPAGEGRGSGREDNPAAAAAAATPPSAPDTASAEDSDDRTDSERAGAAPAHTADGLDDAGARTSLPRLGSS